MGLLLQASLLWMDEIRLHHFETMDGKPMICWYLQRKRNSILSELWGEMDLVHPQ